MDHRNGCPKDEPKSLGEYLKLSPADKMKLFRAEQKRKRRAALKALSVEPAKEESK
jgi:hypothetical protein